MRWDSGSDACAGGSTADPDFAPTTEASFNIAGTALHSIVDRDGNVAETSQSTDVHSGWCRLAAHGKSLKGERIQPGTPISTGDAPRLVESYLEHYINVA
jgi:hypothetical protein